MDNLVSPELLNLAERAARKAIVNSATGREFVVIGQDERLQDISEPNLIAPILPDHIDRTVKLSTTQSMLDYLERYKTIDTVLFAGQTKITAVLDYFAQDPTGLTPGMPAHCKHVAELILTPSEAWTKWTRADGVMMAQADFARLIDENRADISSPDAATVLETVLAFENVRTSKFKQVARTNSNAVDFEFSEGSNGTPRQAKIPTQFYLTLPVFVGEAPVIIEAKLRWDFDKSEPPQLKLGLSLMRVQTMLDQAIERVTERLKAADRPIFHTID